MSVSDSLGHKNTRKNSIQPFGYLRGLSSPCNVISVHNELPPIWLWCIIASDCHKYYLPCSVSLPVHQIISGCRVSVFIEIHSFPRRESEIHNLEMFCNLHRVYRKNPTMHSHYVFDSLLHPPFTCSGLKSSSKVHDSFAAPLFVPHFNMLCMA